MWGVYKIYSYLIIVCLSCTLGNSSKILVFFWFPGHSHGILGNSCVELLLEAGHQVTYLSWGLRSLKSHENLTFIDISFPTSIEERYNIKKILNGDIIRDICDVSVVASAMQRKILALDKVQNLLSNPEEEFDVAILEWMYGEYIAWIHAVLGCPYIWLSTMEPHSTVLNLIGDVSSPAYLTTTHFKNIPPLTFLQRLSSLREHFLLYFYQEFYILPLEKKDYQSDVAPLVAKRRRTVPSYNELRYNASLVLGNSHISTGIAIQLPESYKAVGGYHIKANREPLTKDLKTLMDNSENGVIYFSMGSILKSKDFPDEIISAIIKVFNELEQTVLWKLETDVVSTENNVHFMSWAPQQSILAHPNCVLLISHGGQLSSLEALYFGVPFIGIPVFADQTLNVKKLARKGMAKEVKLSYNIALDLKAAIKEILENSSYAQAAKLQSFIYHHRPVPPRAELVHWVEHVIRTRGAPHLRSISFMVPWYQRYYLDAFAVTVGMIIILLLAFKLLKLTTKSVVIKHISAKKME